MEMELESIFEKYELTPEQYETFRGRFTLRQLRAGDTVISEGDLAETFYFIRSGELIASRLSSDRQEKVLDVLGPGELFGEVGLLHDIPRIASIKAITDAQLYELSKPDFFELLGSNPAFSALLDRLHTLRLLQGIPVFRKLDDEALLKIREELALTVYQAGETLVREGDAEDALYLILKGNARMFSTATEGSEITTGYMRPGSYAGDRGLLVRCSHGYSVVFEDSAKVLVLKKKRFRRLLRRYPRISFSLPASGWLNTILPFFYGREAYLTLPTLAMNRPMKVNWIIGIITLVLILAALLPTLFPDRLPFLHPLVVDTDPENMLSANEPTRVFHNRMKAEMGLHDIMVVGVVNDKHPDGVFNARSLGKVFELSEFARTLTWEDEKHPGKMRGVLAADTMTPSTMDIVEQEGAGTVRFSWLMAKPPKSDAEALEIYRKLKRYPTMDGTLISEDGKAVCLYLPLTSKDISFRVYQALKGFIAKQHGDEQYFITGLPVAEDSFGVEMFIQMAISAPAAMLVIFLLMYFFFRNLTLVMSSMLVAMVSILCTMALLVITGNTLHIMSSMIPIFVMPIAVLDSIHILSEFFEYYPRIKDRRLTMDHVMRELFTPMLYTSLTTAVGFASLSLVPIPPVQVFGIFVSFGVLLAFLLTISFIPAYVMLLPKEKFESLATSSANDNTGPADSTGGWLQRTRIFTLRQSRGIIGITLIMVLLCLFGVQRIIVNDNPVRWFADGHPIRVADKVLNDHFAGTYMAYLALEAKDMDNEPQAILEHLQDKLDDFSRSDPEYHSRARNFMNRARGLLQEGKTPDQLLDALQAVAEKGIDTGPEDALAFWEKVQASLEEVQLERQYFKNPKVLAYISGLQHVLADTGIVGKSISVADFSKTVYRELLGGKSEDYRIPETAQGVAQTYLTTQSGHRPQDLWHFVTPDYRKASIWMLLNSGDNVDMSRVERAVNAYMNENPPPVGLSPGWFGLTYINVIWQEKMVSGMLNSIASGYLAVLLLMVFLLRSTLWGILAMVPLTCTMLIIYGALGLAGKPYDMPVAVLSSLSIGLAVDFTIHFLVRIRHVVSQTGSWQRAMEIMFAEPVRAILRNMLVVAVGFLPLLAAPLVPYNTVGTLIAIILLTSGTLTIFIMGAVLKTWDNRFFPMCYERRTTVFLCRDAVFVGMVGALFITVTIHSFFSWEQVYLPLYLLAVSIPLLYGLYTCRKSRAFHVKPSGSITTEAREAMDS
jgi:predicted RND superfamily exporter protein/CRP-like cAMP-binding protein